jgi:glutamate formiminotransferase
MRQLVECALNFSEGRRQEVIAAVAGAATGVRLLDVSSDADHNRTVVTFLGQPPAVEEAALAIARQAVALIDLRQHRGAHPRMGAVDVIPFVPISSVTMDECVALARHLGERIATELGVPVYLYAAAASAPHRRLLADIRRGEFEGLAAKMQDPAWQPDFGPVVPHPTAGAVVVGARPYLVAFNVNLGTDDLSIAKRIAKAVRARDGGLANVQALGVALQARGLVQVSMNLLDPFATPLYRVFEAVRSEAARYGVPIVGSEVVGLLPLETIVEAARYYLRLEGFATRQVLEARLLEE